MSKTNMTCYRERKAQNLTNHNDKFLAQCELGVEFPPSKNRLLGLEHQVHLYDHKALQWIWRQGLLIDHGQGHIKKVFAPAFRVLWPLSRKTSLRVETFRNVTLICTYAQSNSSICSGPKK